MPKRRGNPYRDARGRFTSAANARISRERYSGKDLLLYHRTSPQAAESIQAGGFWRGRENTGEIFASNSNTGQATGYGEATIAFSVPRSKARLDDEFPSGEKHYAVNRRDVKKILKRPRRRA